jgi:hypothetical protein
MGKAVGLISAAVGRLLSYVPEIGKTFQLASDVFLKNLLWPLRQELIPVLQGILNWVRDNRAMFVRWGGVIVNIFRVVFSVVKAFFSTLEKFWTKVSDQVRKIFGLTSKNIMDLINVLLFKFAVIVTTIQVLLEPVFDFLAESIGYSLRLLKSFFDGFTEGARGVSEPIMRIVDAFSFIGTAFRDLFAEVGDLSGAFKELGNILGSWVLFALKNIAAAITTIAHAVGFVLDGIQEYKEIEEATKNLSGFDQAVKIIEIRNKYSERAKERGRQIAGSVADAYNVQLPESLQPKGTPLQSVNNSNQGNTNINTVNMNINAPNANADEVARKTASELRKAAAGGGKQ